MRTAPAIVALLAASLSGCALIGIGFGPHPTGGSALSMSGSPQEVVVNEPAKKGKEAKLKSGEACTATYLALVTIGDASIEEAAKAAGVKQIVRVDYRRNNVFAYFGYYCTVVYGYG